MKFVRLVLTVFLIALLLSAISAVSCSAKIRPDLAEPEYASAMTENLLLAINDGNYAAFSKDFDESLLKALPESSFEKQFTRGIKGKIGDYEAASKRFYEASAQAQYTTVVYYAAFTQDKGAVLVQISFKTVEGQPRVSGIYFNSPQLRG